MSRGNGLTVVSRRTVVLAAGSAALLLPALAQAEGAPQSGPAPRSPQFADVYARLTQGAEPSSEAVTVDIPETAENGNFVPITINVDSPMTEADHVKAIHVLSTANPFAHVATFHLSPLNGQARVQSRMRLAKTQDVVVLAETSGGKLLMATTLVKVMLGGCAG